jgi:RNA polymerase sigma factor (sigma-70 family)
MKSLSKTSVPPNCDLHSDTTWQKLYPLLRPLVKRWVYSAHVPSWKGQEEDIVEDIVQEAITRLYNYSRRAEGGKVAPIDNLEHMIKAIALNYCRDLQRRERRLLRSNIDDRSSVEAVDRFNRVDPAELAIDNVYQEWLFEKLSKHIVNFSVKQRNALLIDLANLMHFALQPTRLQRAFLREGIKVQDFLHLVPRSSIERGRHAANLSLAYRRLANLYV